ncbi:MAG: IS1380 family transposase [Geodermatophilaceae bacterium]
MHDTTSRLYPVVTADGAGVVSHAGTVLLSEVADRVGLTAALSEATDGRHRRRAGHDPGRVLACVAVAIADGAETISDVQALADQPALHGPVASTATIWRVLDGVDADLLDGLRLARARVRERAWAARGELTGAELPPARAAGRDLNYAVIDIDATLVTAHSDKEGAAGNFKGGWGYHPIGAWLDNTGEALAAILRPGNSGSNTAADHIAVLDLALAQLPDAHRGKPILIRVDGAGFSHSLIEHLAASGLGYSVGFPTNGSVRAAIGLIPAWVWRPAVDAVGGVRVGADVAEITGLLTLGGWPAGMRVIVRRERPHPGAQLDAFEEHDGYRYQAVCTNTPSGSIQFLEARHRAHARVEDRIRCGKDTGIGRFPSRVQAINAAWLETSLIAMDLLAWAQTMLLDGELAKAEPKKLRYRLLHTAARITHGQRRIYLRLAKNWPWALALARAFTRLRLIPLPA